MNLVPLLPEGEGGWGDEDHNVQNTRVDWQDRR